MIVRSKAPLRISFAGGGTDVSPYADEQGGMVLNATINKYAYVTLRPRQDKVVQLHSTAYSITAKYKMEGALPYDGTLDLVKAVINRMFEAPGTFDEKGWLNPGAVGHQVSMRDEYNSSGSFYVCLNGLLALGLPPDDPFWTAPAAAWTQRLIWAGEDFPRDCFKKIQK